MTSAKIRRIVVTGGIATGKSTFLDRLMPCQPRWGHFDCDRAVHQLLTEAPVLATLRQRFGDVIFDGEALNRSALRQLVFADEACRRRLEDLLHPLVRTRCEEDFAAYAAEHPEGLFIVDVPLYFETHGSYPNELVAVVATTRMTQEKRLQERSRWTPEEMAAAISAQLPIEEKVRLADTVIWNEGPVERLDEQVGLFIKRLGVS